MRFLRNSFLFLFSFFPSLVFSSSSEGSCWLSQDNDGHFTIYCEGDGIIYQTVTKEEIVYTYGNCSALKSQMLGALGQIVSVCDSLGYDVDATQISLSNLYDVLGTLPDDSVEVRDSLDRVSSDLSNVKSKSYALHAQASVLSNQVSSINCSSCPTNSTPGSGGSECGEVDFTPILEKMNEAQETRVKIQEDLEISKSVFEGISNTVTYVAFLLEQGFGSTTNELALINGFLSSVTNLPYSNSWYELFRLSDTTVASLNRYRRIAFTGGISIVNTGNPPLDAYRNPSYGYFTSLFSQGFLSTDLLMSLNNYWYYLHTKSLPAITNNLISLTEASTNFFSFFKEDLTVEPVLRDYFNSAQYEDMTYYEFLTNHYIQVSKVAGGNLSGDEAQKTNWFSRIETLLAALVFSDNSKSTNTVDVSSAVDAARSVTDGLSSINSSAVQQSDSLSTSSQSLIQLFTSYCDIFDSAALPSSVVLVSFSNGEGNNSTDIEFGISSNPSFSFMIDSFRFVTTFSWAAVGIFLLWKFIVWASSSVFSACKFVYTMITKTFR